MIQSMTSLHFLERKAGDTDFACYGNFVLGRDGCIYVLTLNAQDFACYGNFVLGRDGCIYALTLNAQILKVSVIFGIRERHIFLHTRRVEDLL